MIQLWRSFRSFDDRGRFSTWMYRIALNVAISFYRRENTRSRFALSGDAYLLNAIEETANHADVLGISEKNVATKISRLKQTMRQEFNLKKGEHHV